MPEITRLPLEGTDRAEFIKAANAVFEQVLKDIEPEHVQTTKALWDVDRYIDHHLFEPKMTPIDRDYALSLIDAFLPQHIIGPAVEADEFEDDPPVRH